MTISCYTFEFIQRMEIFRSNLFQTFKQKISSHDQPKVPDNDNRERISQLNSANMSFIQEVKTNSQRNSVISEFSNLINSKDSKFGQNSSTSSKYIGQDQNFHDQSPPIQPATIVMKKRDDSAQRGNKINKASFNSFKKQNYSEDEKRSHQERVQEQRYLDEQNAYCYSQFIKACELRNNANEASKKSALQILQHLFNEKIMSFKTTFKNYLLKEAIILNYYKLVKQTKQIEKSRILTHSKGYQLVENFQVDYNAKIVQILRIAYLFLKEKLSQIIPTPKGSRIHIIIMILANQQCNSGRFKQALQMCDECLKYLQHKSMINTQMLKIHHLRMNIYHQINNFSAELSQVNKCLFFLKATSFLSNSKKGIGLYQQLLRRKQQLINCKQANQKRDVKFNIKYNSLLGHQKDQEQTQRQARLPKNSFKKRSLSKRKVSKKAIQFECTPSLYQQFKPQSQEKRSDASKIASIVSKSYKGRSISLGKLNQDQIDIMLQKTIQYTRNNIHSRSTSKLKSTTLHKNNGRQIKHPSQKHSRQAFQNRFQYGSTAVKKFDRTQDPGKATKRKLHRKGIPKFEANTPYFSIHGSSTQTPSIQAQQIQRQLDNLLPLNQQQIVDQKISNFIISRPANNNLLSATLFSQLSKKQSNLRKQTMQDFFGMDAGQSEMGSKMFSIAFQKTQKRCQQVVTKVQTQLINKYIQLTEKGVTINFGIVKKNESSEIDMNTSDEDQSDWTEQFASQKRTPQNDESNINKAGKVIKQKKKNKQQKINLKNEYNGQEQSVFTNDISNKQQNTQKRLERIKNRTFQINGLIISQLIGIIEKATIVLTPHDDSQNFRQVRKNWFNKKRPSEDLTNQLTTFNKQSSNFLSSSSQTEIRSRKNSICELDSINENQTQNPYKQINFRLQIQFRNVKFLHKQNVVNGKKNLKVILHFSKSINFANEDRVMQIENVFSIEQQRFIIIKLLSSYIKEHKIDQQSVKQLEERYLCFFRHNFWDDQIQFIGQMNESIYRQILQLYLIILLRNRFAVQELLKSEIITTQNATIKDDIKLKSQQQKQIQESQRPEKIYQRKNLCFEQHKQTIEKVEKHALMKDGFIYDYYEKKNEAKQIKSICLSINQNAPCSLQENQERRFNDFQAQLRQRPIASGQVKTLKPNHILSKLITKSQTVPFVQNPKRLSVGVSMLINKQNIRPSLQQKTLSIQCVSQNNSCYLYVLDKMQSAISISSDQTLIQRQYKTLFKRYKQKLTNYFLKFKSDEPQSFVRKTYAQKINEFYILMKTALVSYLMMPQSQPFSYAMKFFSVKSVTHIHKIKKPEGDKKFNIKMICYTAKNMYSNTAGENPHKIECFYKFQLQQSEKRSRFLKFIMTPQDLIEIVQISNKNDGLNIESVRQRQLSLDEMIKVLMRISQRFILRKQFLYFKLSIENPTDLSYLRINRFNLFGETQNGITCPKRKSLISKRQQNQDLSQSFFSQQLKEVLIPFQKIIKIKYGKYSHYGILTVCKVSGSQLINIRIYLPSKSRIFNFCFQQYKIIEYLSDNDLNKIFGSVISDYADLQKRELSQLIFFDQQQLKSESKLSLVPGSVKRIIWNNFINLIEFDQFWTKQGCELIVKIGNFQGFLKDSSISEYFRIEDGNQKSDTYLIQLSLAKKGNAFMTGKCFESKLKSQPEKRAQLRKMTHKIQNKQYKIKVFEEPNSKRHTAESFIVRQHETDISPSITYISSYFKQEQDILESSVNVLESQTSKQKIYVSLVNCFTLQKINACFYLSSIISKFRNSQLSQTLFKSKNQLEQLNYRSSELNMLLKNLTIQIVDQIKNKFTQQQQQFDFHNFDFQAIFNHPQAQINRLSLNSTKNSKNKYLSKNLTLVNKQILSLKNDKIQCIFYDKKSKELSFYLTSARQRNKNVVKSQLIAESSIPFLQVAGQIALKGLNKRIARNNRNMLLFQY